MKQFTPAEYDRALGGLTEAKRDWVLSDALANTFEDITHDCGLTNEAALLLGKGLTATLLGLVSPTELAEFVRDNLGLTEEQAMEVVAGVTQRILNRADPLHQEAGREVNAQDPATQVQESTRYLGIDPYHEQVW